MVILMDSYSLSEGLFLKNYLGTVSSVPRSRTMAHMETKPSYAYGKYPHQREIQSLQNGVPNHARISYELYVNKEGEIESNKQQRNEIIQKNVNNQVEFIKVIQGENDEEKEKKKEKKWTLGGFFKKKSKKDADESSDNSDEDIKKGFLSRRKSKRDRQKFKSKTKANGFDIVIPQHKENVKSGEITVEQLWSGDPKTTEPNGELVRFINRHPDLCNTKNSLQVPKHSQRDSNLSKINGENTEGKKNRKEVMARAEAKRDLLRDDSSSEEYESYHSSSSLNKHNIDSRRLRRSDRHKRLSKDEDFQSDFRAIKSDFEENRRLRPNCKWISKAHYPESGILDAAKPNLINHSGTLSPCRSPRIRQKLCHMVTQKSYPTSTFPPGIHSQQVRNGSLGLLPSGYNFNKENQPLICNKNRCCEDDRNPEFNLPKSTSSFEKSHRKTLMDYEHFMNSCRSAREKSLSFDQNIHRALGFENESQISQQLNSKRTISSETFTRDGKKVDIYNQSPQILKNPCNEVVENRNDSASCLQSGIFPQSAPAVRRSASGNPLCESSRNFQFDRSNSYNQIKPHSIVPGYCSKENASQPKTFKNNLNCKVSSNLESVSQKPYTTGTSVLRYYADQNPRSRNPIHITCNANISDHPYLSDSQMMEKPFQSQRNSASDFWKLKDKELMKQLKKSENLLKLPPTQNNSRLDRSRSNSPKLKGLMKTSSKSIGSATINECENKCVESNIRKTLTEEHNGVKSPPEPPVRRLSKQEVLARLQKCEQLKKEKNETKKTPINENKIHSNNLDEALIELEMIYDSLRLKDEDLVDRAERRDLPVFRPENSVVSLSVRDEIQSFFAEMDNYKNSESALPVRHQRAIPLRRSGVPDKMADDMAFRRMNHKDRTEVKKLPSQSYLRSSPALFPAQTVSPTFRKESPVLEPDITFDDVMFRNIRHANSTLKIQDPQPPFGIPIGVITPAPDSDYLHAIPTERFRPTFTSSKTPDVVKDDLAFRNLRKDNKTNTCLESNKNELKKRAVRSLSANLYNIMQKDSSSFIPVETNNIVFDKNCEKTRSLTDLTKGKNALEKRLKDLKEEQSAKRAEFFETPQESRKSGAANSCLRNHANLNGNLKNDLATEFQKTSSSSSDGFKFRSPIVELSKFPAAIPSCSLQGNPFKESSFVDDDQLESLLSALAKEAENASKDLEMQLDRLETKVGVKSKDAFHASEVKSRAIEDFDKKFKGLEKAKRRRNLSLSSASESKEEVRKTGSLERRKKTDKSEFVFSEVLRDKTNETNSTIKVTDVSEIGKSGPAGSETEKKLSKSNSMSNLNCRERTRSQNFEAVSDLSEILRDVEVEPYLNNEVILKETNNIFQEIYEYNCKHSLPEKRGSQKDEEDVEPIKEVPRIPDTISDVETEFEKLHQEVNSTKKTKETAFALVDDLMADITSVDQSPSDSYSSFPFPNDNDTPTTSSGTLKHKDGTSSRSSKGEEIPPNPNGLYKDSKNYSEISRDKAEVQINMFSKDKETKNQPTSNFSTDSDRKCEKIENYEDAKGRELSKKQASTRDLIARSSKTTRKKDSRGEGACGLFLKSYTNCQSSDNQVPSSDFSRFTSRRDENKTDSASCWSEEHGRIPLTGIAGSREPVVVRETKASRLRAASRVSSSVGGSPSTKEKSVKDGKKMEKNALKTFISCSPSIYFLNKKDIDKSHTRKSHLNRSHTSEGIYDDDYVPGGSNIRRRRAKNFISESTSAKSSVEKCNCSIAAMGNSNGAIKDPQMQFEELSRTNPLSKSSANACRKTTGFTEKVCLKPSMGKKLAEDLDSRKPQTIQSLEHRFDKSKQIDIATRAEILAASTLKMINRLDEINCKSRTLANSYKRSLPFNSVISNADSGIHKMDGRIISSSEEINGEVSLNRTSVKQDKSNSKKSPERRKPEVKPSILKNKPLGISSPSGDTQKPVSILKRKSLSQDDSQSSPPPVTFSPSVFKKETDIKKQGILKKRRSLDENEVMRRRSYSPEASYDFKSILKTQRRSSMEELTRRSHSPESTPQGILKRKSSKEEDIEDELQGILKRKSLASQNSQQHVKILEKISNGAMDVSGNVRPILKKKSSSEEHSTSEPPLAEVPKSILKKKAGLEVDEPEEKPMKPILKSSRIPSTEEPEEGKRNKSLIFNAFDEPKPILKRENSRSVEGENAVVLRNVISRRERPHSSSEIENELSAILLKRRSLEFQPISVINFDLELQKTKRTSSNDKWRENSLKRSMSVAEKINNFENFLKFEKMERERRNSPPGTPPSNFVEKNKMESEGAVFSSSSVFPTTRLENSTGQITSKFSSDHHRKRTSPDKETLEGQTSAETFSSYCASSSTFQGNHDLGLSDRSDVKSRVSLKFKKSSLGTPEDAGTNQLFGRSSFRSAESEQVVLSNPLKESEGKNDTNFYYSVKSCGEKISNLSLKELPIEDSGQSMDARHSFPIQKSGSVPAKNLLFKEIEKKKVNKEVEEVMEELPENNFINHGREEKLLDTNAQRHRAQPSSTEEFEQVDLRKSKSKPEDGCGDGDENHEDELCTMSYKDRLRLFESTFTPKFLHPVPKKRGIRYRTQPVTTDEVETAKSQRPSFTFENSSVRNEDERVSGLPGFKENKRDLSNSHIKSEPIKSKPKGILKNLSSSNESKTSNSDSDSSASEKKGILKNELNENTGNLKRIWRKADPEANSELKGILKQPPLQKKLPSSNEEESLKDECKISPSRRSPGANLASILQKVEAAGQSEKRKISQKDEFRVQPKCMQNAGIAKVINRSKNNSPLVKSQSHLSMSSLVQSPLKCTFPDDIPSSSTVSDENIKIDRGKEENPTSESPAFRGECCKNTVTSVRPSDEDTDDDLNGASIHERLARLKKSGELDWQKRKSHVINLEEELSVITTGNYLFNDHCLPTAENLPSASEAVQESEDFLNSSSILADRLGKLDVAKQGWKKRVKPSDAVRFSVEGKMLDKKNSSNPSSEDHQTSPTRTPLVERKKRSPKAVRFKSKQCDASSNAASSTLLERINYSVARSVSVPGDGKDGLFSLAISGNLKGPVITVPKNDDETFSSFYEGLNNKQTFQERLEIKDEDLDAVTKMKSSQLLVQKRNIKTQKRRATVKNPVKALATRLNLQEYTEIKTGIAENELKRMKVEKVARSSTLAIEALAGLASQEDFTAINLKKAAEGNVSSPDPPYKDKMLLHVKGRRHVQTRLIEPIASNINTGDCFILVTPNRVFHYVGEFANVIEKSRGAEISLYIQQKGDLGCTTSSVVTIGEGGRATSDQVKEFWSLLDGEPGCEKVTGNVDEDELFESALVDTNMVYEVLNNELIPVETYWGSMPKIGLLDPNKILVFDFGSEFYVWNGKNVSVSKRKFAIKLAKELWEEGFDYTDCDLCPLNAASYLGGQASWCEIPDFQKAGPVRPAWALFAKLTQNMETILFREKFSDWPDYTKGSCKEKKNGDNDQALSSTELNFEPCDAKKMLDNILPEPYLILEGNNLGRGVRYFDEETRRCSEITTQNITVWHVNDYEYSEVPAKSAGQFHAEDNYVVRWHYFITSTGRELSGQPSKHLTTGRNRYAYFFWQGHDSPIKEKGAAACLTVELDKEHGPQVRVVQGFEPPAFVNLFKGGMVVHKGRRCSQLPREKLRLFICRGAMESESALFEVSCSMRQLRSLASFVLVNRITGKIIVWHGRKSPENFRKFAFNAAKRLHREIPEFEFKAKEINIREELEGSESQEFVTSLGGDNRQLYYSFKDETELRTPRLFHLTSVSGEFLFNEVTSPLLTKDSLTPLPFLQSDLYSVPQPALFLLDSCSGLWLWQGWWEESPESERGSGQIRFQAERRAAMLTAMAYWNLKYKASTPKAFLIWAGLEPLVFTNQFPFWTDRDDVAEINMKEGRKPGEAVPISIELASATQSTYPLAQLQNRPLPDGVNPTFLENYLEPQCFPKVFAMEKEEFLNLPSWKKKKLKQDAGLF